MDPHPRRAAVLAARGACLAPSRATPSKKSEGLEVLFVSDPPEPRPKPRDEGFWMHRPIDSRRHTGPFPGRRADPGAVDTFARFLADRVAAQPGETVAILNGVSTELERSRLAPSTKLDIRRLLSTLRAANIVDESTLLRAVIEPGAAMRRRTAFEYVRRALAKAHSDILVSRSGGDDSSSAMTLKRLRELL